MSTTPTLSEVIEVAAGLTAPVPVPAEPLPAVVGGVVDGVVDGALDDGASVDDGAGVVTGAGAVVGAAEAVGGVATEDVELWFELT